MRYLEFLPETILDALAAYGRGDGNAGNFSDMQACLEMAASTHVHLKLDDMVKDAVAPNKIHAFMSTLTVFSPDRQKSADAMKAWFDLFGVQSGEVMAKWLDLSNIASESKRSYGHEIMMHAFTFARGNPMADPQMILLQQARYLRQPRTMRGPLHSILTGCSLAMDSDGAAHCMVKMAMDAEANVPGCCATQDAAHAFASSACREEILHISIQAGVKVEQWPLQENSQHDWRERIRHVERMFNSAKAANMALSEVMEGVAVGTAGMTIPH